MKLFKHQYGGFLKEAPESSAWANISAGSDTLGMQKGDANILIEKLPNSMGGDTIQRYRVSQLLPRGGKRTISNGTGDYKSIIDRWKQQYGGGYSSVNVGGDVDTEDMNYEDLYTAPEEYQFGGNLYLSDGSMAEIDEASSKPTYIQTPMSDDYYIETYRYMNPETGAYEYFRNYKKGELPTEKSKRSTKNPVNEDKYRLLTREFILRLLKANPLKWKRTPGGYSNY